MTRDEVLDAIVEALAESDSVFRLVERIEGEPAIGVETADDGSTYFLTVETA